MTRQEEPLGDDTIVTTYTYDPNGNQYMTLSADLSEESDSEELGLTTEQKAWR
ncbi:MAG: hypothetical protein HFI90_01135 [Clostridia bacterium]|nr:hypothetical protein [Clostridia bacterium]